MVQDGSVAASAAQPALPRRGVGVETCNPWLIVWVIQSCQAMNIFLFHAFCELLSQYNKRGCLPQKEGGGENSDKAGTG